MTRRNPGKPWAPGHEPARPRRDLAWLWLLLCLASGAGIAMAAPVLLALLLKR